MRSHLGLLLYALLLLIVCIGCGGPAAATTEGSNVSFLEDDQVPLAENPDVDTELFSDDADGDISNEQIEVSDESAVNGENENDFLLVVQRVINMYETGVFENDNPNASRYAKLPEGVVLPDVSGPEDYQLETDMFFYKYCAVIDMGNSYSMMIGMEKSGDEWDMGGVLFITEEQLQNIDF